MPKKASGAFVGVLPRARIMACRLSARYYRFKLDDPAPAGMAYD